MGVSSQNFGNIGVFSNYFLSIINIWNYAIQRYTFYLCFRRISGWCIQHWRDL